MTNYKHKILYLITQSELGGAQVYVRDLSLGLKDEYNITVAFGEQGDDGELAKILKSSGISTHVIPHLKRSINPYNDLRALFEIKKLIKKIQPDIIHLNSSKISILGSLAIFFIRIFAIRRLAFIREISIIYTVHGWVFNEPLSYWKKLFYKYSEKFTARWKDKLICVSNYDENLARKERLCPSAKLATIHNGIKIINFFTKENSLKELKKLVPGYKLLNTNYHIGAIGNLYPTKGFEYLIQSIAIMRDYYKIDVNLTIIGEGRERRKLEKIIKNLSLKTNVTLAGRVGGAYLLKAFDIYACSSVKEGLSYTVIEAMQAGLPIAATEVGGNGELIKNYESGILLKPKNPNELARAINRFIKDPEFAKKLGSVARDRALKHFTLDKMILNTKNLYRELLK